MQNRSVVENGRLIETKRDVKSDFEFLPFGQIIWSGYGLVFKLFERARDLRSSSFQFHSTLSARVRQCGIIIVVPVR
jgi:hypothetical protein